MNQALGELADGATYWRSHTTWPRDFHNADYATWARQRPAGEITLAWWRQYQLPRLRRWIATRPVSSTVLTSRFADRLTELSAAWKETCLPRSEDDISTVSWDDVMSLPAIAAEIKPMQSGSSAVFTSKFCHFLLPKIYPVVDNAALGGSYTYKAYFQHVQKEWESTSRADQQALRAELSRLIQDVGQPPSGDFPMINKIIEVRLIGRRHPAVI